MAFTLMKNIKKKIDYNKPGAENTTIIAGFAGQVAVKTQ